jgi:hypothetical protein
MIRLPDCGDDKHLASAGYTHRNKQQECHPGRL